MSLKQQNDRKLQRKVRATLRSGGATLAGGAGPKPECWVMLGLSGNEASHRQIPAQWKSWGPREAPLMIQKVPHGPLQGHHQMDLRDASRPSLSLRSGGCHPRVGPQATFHQQGCGRGSSTPTRRSPGSQRPPYRTPALTTGTNSRVRKATRGQWSRNYQFTR